jgi:hypothetical protein
MSPLTVFLWSVIVMIVFVSSYDVYRYIRYGREGTISHAMWLRGNRNPLFAFFVGVAVGGIVFGLAVHFWGT